MAAMALPAAVHAQTQPQWLGPATQICEGTCVLFLESLTSSDYSSATFNLVLDRSALPENYLAGAGCMNARTETGWRCNPDWIVAVYTLPNQPRQDGGYLAPRGFIIATQNIGKINKEGQPGISKIITFDSSTPGTISYTCKEKYSGLQAYTNYRVLVYPRNRVNWHKSLAWRDFQTRRIPDNPHPNYCG